MKFSILIKTCLTTPLILILLLQCVVNAQLARERVQADEPVYNVFWATTNIGQSTVRNVSSNTINTSILHTFGPVRGGVDRFFGLDDGANTRIGIDYGISDRFSLGLGRMTFNKVVDVRSKYNILRQTTTDSMPLELAVKVSVGITTMPGTGMEFNDRLSYFTSLMIARKMDRLSLQISPMIAHFNTTIPGNPGTLYGLGLLANYELNDRFALSAEYLPVLGDRNIATEDAMAIALNIDTGGHVFQLFFASAQWHNEQFIMANNRDRFWEGDFRFGFNIHRVFGLKRN